MNILDKLGIDRFYGFMVNKSYIKLDPAKLLGFLAFDKNLSNSNDQISAKTGAKTGTKTSGKVGAKIGSKLDSKLSS